MARQGRQRGADFAIAPEPAPPGTICDFCGARGPTWLHLPGRSARRLRADDDLLGSDWAACDPCHALIEEPNPAALRGRAAVQYVASGWPKAVAEAAIDTAHTMFWNGQPLDGQAHERILEASARAEGQQPWDADAEVTYAGPVLTGQGAANFKGTAHTIRADAMRIAKAEGRPWQAVLSYAMEASGMGANYPVYAGARSWPIICRAVDQGCIVEWTGDGSTPGKLSAAGVAYLRSWSVLEYARPVRIDPSQAAVLPAMAADEADDFMESLRLPLDPLYLEFMRPNGTTVTTEASRVDDRGELRTGPIEIASALVWTRENDDGHDTLYVVPFSRVPESDGRGGYTGRHPLSRDPWYYEALGIACWNRRADDVPAIPEEWATLPGDDNHGEVGFVGLRRFADGGRSHGMLVPGVSVDDSRTAEDRNLAEQGMAFALVAGVVLVATVMHFIESHNVEIVDGDLALERREVKRARKRGWEISDVVVVRHRRSRRTSSTNGAGRNYSHQFEVEGHYNHVARGTHVRCRVCLGEEQATVEACPRCQGTGLDPDKVKPCSRRDQHGVLTCPYGCRREWVPPSIKGPEDKPFVPKTRIVK